MSKSQNLCMVTLKNKKNEIMVSKIFSQQFWNFLHFFRFLSREGKGRGKSSECMQSEPRSSFHISIFESFAFLLVVASGILSEIVFSPHSPRRQRFNKIGISKPDWSPCDRYRVSKASHRRLQQIFDIQWDSNCKQLRQHSYREPR